MVGVKSVFDGKDFGVDLIDSFGVGSSGRVETFVFKPFAVLLEEDENLRNGFGLGVFPVGVGEVFFPFVDHGFELVFLFIGFENNSVLVEHFAFKSEILLQLLLSVETELLSLKLNWSLSLFLCLFDFKFFLFNRLRLSLSAGWLIAFFFLFFLFLLLGSFWLWNFSFLSPFFYQVALFKSDQTILSELNFKAHTESLMLWVLSRSSVIPDMLVKSINTRFILNQNFNWFSSFKLNRLA